MLAVVLCKSVLTHYHIELLHCCHMAAWEPAPVGAERPSLPSLPDVPDAPQQSAPPEQLGFDVQDLSLIHI